jgi:hypothetical protein
LQERGSPGKKYATGERNQEVLAEKRWFVSCLVPVLLNPTEYVCVPPVFLVVVDVLNQKFGLISSCVYFAPNLCFCIVFFPCSFSRYVFSVRCLSWEGRRGGKEKDI